MSLHLKYVVILMVCCAYGISQVPKNKTGFNIQQEYEKNIKSYPFIKMIDDPSDSTYWENGNLTYCKLGDRQLKTDVFGPSDKNNINRTAIIIIHGGGWQSGDKTIHHSLAKKLATLGYVCFTPEYRLSGEAVFPAAVYDLKAMIRWVRSRSKHDGIDPDKIVVAGHSAGGELAAFLGTTNGMKTFSGTKCSKKESDKVNAIIDIDGLLAFIHPESGEGDDSKNLSSATRWFGVNKVEGEALWIKGSPLTYVSANTPPTLFLNSSVARMHAGREDYIQLMNQYGLYTEVHAFEKAPHSFCLFEPWFESTVLYIDGFLQKVFENKRVK